MKWSERLRRASKRGTFTDKDRELAGEWKTCAVGEMLGKNMSFPLPSPIVNDGSDFNAAVYFNRVEEAKIIYKRIRESKGKHE